MMKDEYKYNSSRLIGWEAHGFRTMEELDVKNIMKEAKARWLRPNEIHAILCNCSYFIINVKPMNLPTSGTIVLFDRKTLRNFRKDGHNWRRKNDGKTVKEAHEHLKVGNEERIHVYYAHGEDNPTFVRRCYWLLDKTRENIVLVHYRETQEGFPATSLDSNSTSVLSGLHASLVIPGETDYGATPACDTAEKENLGNGNFYSLELGGSTTLKNYETRLHEISALEWEELLAPSNPKQLSSLDGGKCSFLLQQSQYETNEYPSYMDFQTSTDLQKTESPSVMVGNSCQSLDVVRKDSLQSQDSFDMWMNGILADSPVSHVESVMQSSSSISMSMSPAINHLQSPVLGQIFNISDISPAWAFSTEETKILITGCFSEGDQHLAEFDIYCVCGDVHVRLEMVQSGVYRCFVSPHSPGLVDFYLSFDQHTPISKILTFEYRSPLMSKSNLTPTKDEPNWDEFRVQMRLVHILFLNSERVRFMASNFADCTLNEAKTFVSRTSHIAARWADMIQSMENNKNSIQQAKGQLFELSLMNRLCEWLVERILDGCKTADRDEQGQGVIHLCAILGYRWAVYPYAASGLPLDYRDKFGWTALHWAAYYGREKMVATLLSAGAKPYLVTDSTSQNLGGCTAADLASKNGHDGLAACLAEIALLNHFNDMTIAGNVSGSLQTSASHSVTPLNGSEDLCLKDSLTAYRTAADAAARIHAAFREHSFKLRMKTVKFSNPEDEARSIVAAMKIQQAFRNYGTHKKMVAAAQIQYRFRTWKTRKDFLKLRRHTVKIQVHFRGFRVRKQYCKVVWSVSVLEKAILRWRMKRQGFRGLKINTVEVVKDQDQESVVQEDFFRASRKQAEERIERSVVRVQAIFRSKIAQEEYRRMKLAVDEAKLEYEGLIFPEINM